MDTSDIIATVAAAFSLFALILAGKMLREARKSRETAEESLETSKKSLEEAEKSATSSAASAVESKRSADAAEHANRLTEEARDRAQAEAERIRFSVERQGKQRFALVNGPTLATNVRLMAPNGYILKDDAAGEPMGPNAVRGFIAVGTAGAPVDAVEVHCDELESPAVLVLP